MSRSDQRLPESPNLEYLKRRARELLAAYRADQPDAVQRASTRLPRLVSHAGSRFVLADALLVIASESGFRSWPALKRHVESLAGLSARQRHVQLLGQTLAALADERMVEALAARLARTPMRDLLDARAWLVDHGGYASVVDVLVEGACHSRARVRFDSAGALDHMADARCFEPLRRLLTDSVPRVRRAALHSLTCAPCKLEPLPEEADAVALFLSHASSDPSVRVRRAAVDGLVAARADPRAEAMLRTLAGERSILGSSAAPATP